MRMAILSNERLLHAHGGAHGPPILVRQLCPSRRPHGAVGRQGHATPPHRPVAARGSAAPRPPRRRHLPAQGRHPLTPGACPRERGLNGHASITGLCVACGRCVEACPNQALALQLDDDRYVEATIRRLERKVNVR
ncbi:MAG: 4Fe-4S binding protein [Anaerolineae bacterium]